VWGYITASLATFFVGQEARSERGEVAGSKDLAALAREVALLRRELVDSRRDQVPARTPG
jgi:voltage-gated potassium channel